MLEWTRRESLSRGKLRTFYVACKPDDTDVYLEVWTPGCMWAGIEVPARRYAVVRDVPGGYELLMLCKSLKSAKVAALMFIN